MAEFQKLSVDYGNLHNAPFMQNKMNLSELIVKFPFLQGKMRKFDKNFHKVWR